MDSFKPYKGSETNEYSKNYMILSDINTSDQTNITSSGSNTGSGSGTCSDTDTEPDTGSDIITESKEIEPQSDPNETDSQSDSNELIETTESHSDRSESKSEESESESKGSALLRLYNVVMIYGYVVRVNRSDGLEAWNNIKPKIPKESLEWDPSSKSIYSEMKQMGVKGDDSDPKDMTWEPHHFMIQHGRIIKNNPEGSLQRLLQIAYNTGQLIAEMGNRRSYGGNLVSYIMRKNFFSMETFIPRDEISRLDDKLSEHDITRLMDIAESFVKNNGDLNTKESKDQKAGNPLIEPGIDTTRSMSSTVRYVINRSMYFHLYSKKI